MAVTGTITDNTHFQTASTVNPNNELVGKTSDGTLWTLVPEMRWLENSQARLGSLWRSNDNGATWTLYQAMYDSQTADMGVYGVGDVGQFAMYIDQNDVFHLVYSEPRFNIIYYQRGTKTGTAGNYGWSWSSKYTLDSVQSLDVKGPAITVHMNGTSTVIHVFWYGTQGFYGQNQCMYRRVTVSSGGSISLSSTTTFATGTATRFDTAKQRFRATFYNTGDGKTVKNGTPHVLVAWANSAATGTITSTAGYPWISYVKLTYSGGSWSMGSINTIPDYGDTYGSNPPSVMCDGTNFVIGGIIGQGYSDTSGHTTKPVVVAWDINPSTLAATRVVYDDVKHAYQMHYGGGMMHAPNRDLYFIGTYYSASFGSEDSGRIVKWVRSTGQLYAAWSKSPSGAAPVVTPGPVTDKILFVTSAETTPYNRTFYGLTVGGNYSQPILTSHTLDPDPDGLYTGVKKLDPRKTNILAWTEGPGDVPSQYKVYHGSTAYGATFTTVIQSAETFDVTPYGTEGGGYSVNISATSGDMDGPPLSIRIDFTSWLAPIQTVNTTQALATLDTTGLEVGKSYEVQIKAIDNTGAKSTNWSNGATFALTDAPTTNVYLFDGTAWVPVTRKILDDVTWKDHLVQKL